MTTPNNPADPKDFDMGKMARSSEEKPAEPPARNEIINVGEDQKSASGASLSVRPAANILDASDNAWLEGTRGLQRNLIRQLQEAKSSWSEGRLIGAKRQQVISEVTDKYVMFLREEARMTSEAALQARKSYLARELLSIQAEIKKELADMTGKSVKEIEAIFREHVSQIQTEELQKAYARYVFNHIFDLMGIEPPK